MKDGCKAEQEVAPDCNQGEINQLTSKTNIELQEYVVERIGRHFGSKSNRSYVVRWYWCSAKVDNFGPTQHTRNTFIHRYWSRHRKDDPA